MRVRSLFLAITAINVLAAIPSEGQTWKAMFSQADSLSARRQNDSALIIGKLALHAVRDELTRPDTSLAYACQKAGRYAILAGKWNDGRIAYEEALKIREQIQGEQHLDLIYILLPLGVCYQNLDELNKAESAFVREIEIIERAQGSQSLLLEKPMMNLAGIWTGIGRRNDAENLEQRLLKMRLQAYGATHMNVAFSYLNIGNRLLSEGMLVGAEENTRRALEIFEKAGNPRASEIPMALNNLGQIYFEQARFSDSEQLLLKALALKEEIHGYSSTMCVSTLNNLGKLYLELGDYDKAAHFYRRAFSITEKAMGLSNSFSMSSLMRTGEFYSLVGLYSEADSLLSLAKESAEKRYGTPMHPLVASSMRSLAESRFRQHDYVAAESLSAVATGIHEATLGRKNLNFAESLELYARCLRQKGRLHESLVAFEEAFNTKHEFARNNYSVMSERDALVSSRSLKRVADYTLSTISDLLSTKADVSATGVRIVLNDKGQVDEMAYERKSLALSEKDSHVKALLGDWRTKKARLSNFYTREHEGRSLDRARVTIDSLSKIINDLESELARRSLSFRKLKEYNRVTIERITDLLPQDSPLVEYFKFNYKTLEPDSTIDHYLVLMLDTRGKPILKDLGEADKIDKLIEQYRLHFLKLSNLERPISENDQREYNSISGKLYTLVWAPIAQHIQKGTTLFIAPDGGLNLISFAGLMDEKGKYLIEKHPIHYLSAGRDLIRLSQDSTASGTGLLALGDPDYDATMSERLSNEKTFAVRSVSSTESNAVRNLRSNCEALSDMKASRLPNTKTEVDAIANYFPSSNVFEGRAASEENFKKNAAGRKAIHIATHGYFISGECQEKLGKKSDSFVGENPLLRSGLFLAGANLHGSDIKNDEAEDGIVTALEVSAIDLRGTDLVVLSACETGLGKVEQGEGVYGLRRAFQMAGAKTVVSSLWQVSDDETMKFMRTLYATKAKTYPELMQQVALQRIKEARLRGRPTHPFTWGAFVATGEWRIKP